MPLTKFDNLTGVKGDLTGHAERKYHLANVQRMNDFLAHYGTDKPNAMQQVKFKPHYLNLCTRFVENILSIVLEYLRVTTRTPLPQQCDGAAGIAKCTRDGVTSLIDTVKWMAAGNIPLRGHEDDGRIDPTAAEPEENGMTTYTF